MSSFPNGRLNCPVFRATVLFALAAAATPAGAQTFRAASPAEASAYCATGCNKVDAIARPGNAGNASVRPQQLEFNGSIVAGANINPRLTTGNAFRLAFDPSTQTITYFVENGATQVLFAPGLDRFHTLFLLARGRSTTIPASYSGLTFNGVALDSLGPGLGSLSSTGAFEYVSLSNINGNAPWTLEGTLVVAGGNGEAPRTTMTLIDEGPDIQLGAGSETLYVFGDPLVTDAGILAGDATVFSSLEFVQTSDGLYSGSLAGPGQIEKSGPGALTLSGDSSGFAGSTRVSEGALSLAGTLGGSLSVAPGGILSGTGTALGAVTVADGGVIAPGNSIGTLTVGSLDLAGTYEVEFTAPGTGAPLIASGSGQSVRGQNSLLDPGLPAADQNADLIVVSGGAQIQPGANVVLSALGSPQSFEDALDLPGNTNREIRYQILSAGTGITGTFVALSDAAATLEYLDAGGGAQEIWLALSVPDVPPIVLVPAAPSPYELPSGVERPRCDARANGERYCAVVQGNYLDFGYESSGLVPGGGAFGWNGLLGLAYMLDNGLQVGVGYSQADGEASTFDGSGSGDLSRNGGILWAEWESGPWDLRGWLGLYESEIDAVRQSVLGGAARADVSATETTVAFEARRWTALRPNLSISPVVGFDATWLKQDAYTETGGGAENFSAAATRKETLNSVLGVELQRQDELGGRPVFWQAGLGWRHNFGDAATSVSGTYQGDPTQTVLSGAGPDLSRDSIGMSLGATVAITDRTALRLSYSAAFADDWDSQALTFRLSTRF